MKQSKHAEHMRIDRPDSVQLTLYVAEPHVGDRRAKVDQLLHRAAELGMSGGTALQAFRGFGRRHSHEGTIWHRSEETPLTVFFVDRSDRIDGFLLEVDEILPDVVAVTEKVRAIRYIRPHQH